MIWIAIAILMLGFFVLYSWQRKNDIDTTGVEVGTFILFVMIALKACNSLH